MVNEMKHLKEQDSSLALRMTDSRKFWFTIVILAFEICYLKFIKFSSRTCSR